MIKIKKKSYNLALPFSLIFLLLSFSLNISAADTDLDSADDLLHKEQIERQEQQLNANLLVKKANKSFLDKKYEIARDQCLGAIAILSKISPPNKITKTKIINIRDLLAMVYSYWANDILKQADSSADTGKLENAILLCRQAAEMNPKLSAHSDEMIKKFNQKIRLNKYKDITSESKFNPNRKKTLYNIDVLYEQGKKLYNNKNYTEAKNKFEQLLVLDPYNSNAIYYLKNINDEIYYTGQNRQAVISDKRTAEAEWKSLPPIIAKTLSGDRIDIAANIPIAKKPNVDILQKKLDDIIIKHIAFEEVPLKTAVMFLKRESKKLDPEGKGINIFLRISEKKPAQQESEASGSEGDADWEDEGTAGTESDEIEEEFADQYLITMVLDNVPLGKALEYVSAAAGLNYNVSNYAVEISSSNISSTMETAVFPIEVDQYIKVQTEADGSTLYTIQLKAFFSERGIKFPEGSSAVYDAKVSRLIVRNTPAEISKLSKLLTELNKNAPQISIAAKFVEIEQKDFEELGFEWRTGNLNPDASSRATSWENNDQINNFALVNGATTDPKYDRAFGVNYVGDPNSLGTDRNGLTFDAVIHALDQNEKINLLSAPKVTTLSGQKATIKMTTDTYYPTEWSKPTLTTQSSGITPLFLFVPPAPIFKDPTENGIVFFVTPFVASDRYTIDLELEPQIQKFIGWSDYTYQVSRTASTTTETTDPTDPSTDDTKSAVRTKDAVIKMPKFKIQAIQTHLKIYDGETVVLGGVVKDETDTTDDRIPILGDVPLIGRFFRSEIEDANKTNLLIFTKVLLVNPDGTPLRPKPDNSLPNFRYQ